MKVLYQSILSSSAIRQRPHFMAAGLAESGLDVFWLYTAVAGRCRPKSWATGREIPAIPFASRWRAIDLLNRLWLGMRLRDIHPDVVVATNPITWYWLPKRLRALPTVYDCMDDHEQFFEGRRRRRLLRDESALVASARRIVASSPVVAERLAARYRTPQEAIEVVPNAYDPQDFLRAPVFVSTDHPAIVYAGTIGAWFDWASVIDAAMRYPNWTFRLVGPCETLVPSLPQNVRFEGAVAHSVAADWMRSADALVLPFRRTLLVEGVDPVKMYEYLATGRPIVSAWWPLLDKFAGFPAVSFYGDGARDQSALSDVLEKALANTSDIFVPQDFLAENTWAHRAARLAQIVREAA